ncbi:disulfide bond formation protein B [Sphingomonas sp. ID0503]|uniref:disulfide bond formation protein B n=1 Tax=Sphingomonas sp. ID0503 TaxID=3399691 RepID=UPI003AFAD4BB
MTRFGQARALALAVPLALVAGAYAFQFSGYPPCEMCWWQRYPHFAAIALALLAFAVPKRALVALAATAILISGAIGVFHAGVEYRWWEGLTRCAATAPAASGADFLKEIMATPTIRCDTAPWDLFGISLAGWNAIVSIPFALLILWRLSRA